MFWPTRLIPYLYDWQRRYTGTVSAGNTRSTADQTDRLQLQFLLCLLYLTLPDQVTAEWRTIAQSFRPQLTTSTANLIRSSSLIYASDSHKCIYINRDLAVWTKWDSGEQWRREIGRECSAYGEKSSTYGVCCVLESEEKGLVGRCGRRRENNIEVDVNESEWERVEWIDVAQYSNKLQAVVITVMNCRVP